MNKKANDYIRDLFDDVYRKAKTIDEHAKKGSVELLFSNWYEALQSAYSNFRKLNFEFYCADLLSEKDYEAWRLAAGTIYLEAMKMIEV